MRKAGMVLAVCLAAAGVLGGMLCLKNRVIGKSVQGIVVDWADFNQIYGDVEADVSEEVLLKVPQGDKIPKYYFLADTLQELNTVWQQKLELGDAVRVNYRPERNPGLLALDIGYLDIIRLVETEKTAEMDFAEYEQAEAQREAQQHATDVYGVLAACIYESEEEHPARACFSGVAAEKASVILSLTDTSPEIVQYYRDLVEQAGRSFDCVELQESAYSWDELFEMRNRAVELLAQDCEIVTHFTDERTNTIEIVVSDREVPDPREYFDGCEGIEPEIIRITRGEPLP